MNVIEFRAEWHQGDVARTHSPAAYKLTHCERHLFEYCSPGSSILQRTVAVHYEVEDIFGLHEELHT